MRSKKYFEFQESTESDSQSLMSTIPNFWFQNPYWSIFDSRYLDLVVDCAIWHENLKYMNLDNTLMQHESCSQLSLFISRSLRKRVCLLLGSQTMQKWNNKLTTQLLTWFCAPFSMCSITRFRLYVRVRRTKRYLGLNLFILSHLKSFKDRCLSIETYWRNDFS